MIFNQCKYIIALRHEQLASEFTKIHNNQAKSITLAEKKCHRCDTDWSYQ